MLKVVQGGPGEVIKTKPAPTAPPTSTKTVVAPTIVSEHGRGGGSTSRGTGKKPTKQTETGYATPATVQPKSTDPAPPTSTPKAPTTAVLGGIISTNTGSASAAAKGYTTSGPAQPGQSGYLNVPETEKPPATTQPTAPGGGGGTDGGGSGGRTTGSSNPPGTVTTVNAPMSVPPTPGKSPIVPVVPSPAVHDIGFELGGITYAGTIEASATVEWTGGIGPASVSFSGGGISITDGPLTVSDSSVRLRLTNWLIDRRRNSTTESDAYTATISLGASGAGVSTRVGGHLEFSAKVTPTGIETEVEVSLPDTPLPHNGSTATVSYSIKVKVVPVLPTTPTPPLITKVPGYDWVKDQLESILESATDELNKLTPIYLPVPAYAP